MYRIRRTTFPKNQTVEVPRYSLGAVHSKGVELTQEIRRIEVNFAAMDARWIASATGVQPEGWEIRGLIAVEAAPLAHALQQAVAEGTSRKFGAVLGDEWYRLIPLEQPVPARAGQYVVVGLYR
ncbi:hypothetical protein ACFFLM_06450 [Deinococcus oregonensis]|uniref:Uncharacterized protein n=1 Tax=Deinococcus oregonensis TaxID=1805970 RepID=A0ABV6AVT5_9DEIO